MSALSGVDLSLPVAAQDSIAVQGPDPGPLARFEAVKEQEHTPTTVFQKLTDPDAPQTLAQIGRDWGLPVGRFVEWFSTTHTALYDAALKVRADQDVHDAVAIADNAAPESVQVAKLRSEVRKWRASKWDSERYGDKTQVKHTGLVPTLVIEIAAPEQPKHRVIEHEPAEPI